MIFSIQRYLEDYFERRGLTDTDQYAVKVANTYRRSRSESSDVDIRRSLHQIRTAFFRVNSNLDRSGFEGKLIQLLDSRFLKKNFSYYAVDFPGGVTRERHHLLSAPRRNIRLLLGEFRYAVEARAIDAFWKSRTKGQLKPHPESIGQSLLGVFVEKTIWDTKPSHAYREVVSGVGFVDVGIHLTSVTHLVEMKVLKSSFVGPEQLETYMKTERRREGWLVVFDARDPVKKTPIVDVINTASGTIHIVLIDINPVPPSKRKP